MSHPNTVCTPPTFNTRTSLCLSKPLKPKSNFVQVFFTKSCIMNTVPVALGASEPLPVPYLSKQSNPSHSLHRFEFEKGAAPSFPPSPQLARRRPVAVVHAQLVVLLARSLDHPVQPDTMQPDHRAPGRSPSHSRTREFVRTNRCRVSHPAGSPDRRPPRPGSGGE
jgi:hypothetical protein